MKRPGKNEDKVWLGFDIQTAAGPILRPTKIQFWKDEDFRSITPDDPFYYHADALVGLSLVHLNPHLKNPFAGPDMNFPFCNEAWRALEPHHEMFQRSQPRIQALRHSLKEQPAEISSYFERNFTDVLEGAIHPWGIDLNHLHQLIDSLEYLEMKLQRPLVYNFALKFSRGFVEKLHYLHSLLFNLRSLVASDYNSYIKDATHEAMKVDSITDYLSKAEYISNDALLYYNFKQCKSLMPEKTYALLEKNYRTFSHNGFCLVEALPKSFLASLAPEELEEALYIAQMDWLLGTDAGLLFRLREELYGLAEGYERIFYPELSGKHFLPGTELAVNCEVTAETLYKDVA